MIRRIAPLITLCLLVIPVEAHADGSAGAATISKPVAAPTTKRSTAAKIVVPTAARERPGAGKTVMRLHPTAPIGGGSHQLLIVESRTVRNNEYLRVLLPKRPNGASGWVRRSDVALVAIPYRVLIDISDRRVTVYKAGKVAKRIRAVVGSPRTPTPTGRFAISEHLRQANPNAFTGSYITLLTAFSNVHYSFDGGPGRVAMHGRGGASLSDPLGSARSNGCIRMNNKDASWIAKTLPAGTPVMIRK